MYRMQVLHQVDYKHRAPGVCAKKHSSVWWSLPKLDRDLIQCKQCLELAECAEGIGCLSLQWALTQLLLWLWTLGMIFITVTGASFKDRDFPMGVCKVTQIRTCYIALTRCVQGAHAPNSLYIHTEQIKGCLFTAKSKLTLATSQTPPKDYEITRNLGNTPSPQMMIPNGAKQV